MKMILTILITLCLLLPINSATDITIYSDQNSRSVWGFSSYYNDNNLALVRDQRSIELNNGLNTFSFTDVASLIDPTSILLNDNTCNINIKEQNYMYDILDNQKLLEKYIEKDITIVISGINGDEEIIGTLLSATPQIVLRTSTGLISISNDNIKYINFPVLPEGLITKPTLKWTVDSSCGQTHDLEVSYLTKGMSWKADYVAKTNQDETLADIQAWVTIDNKAGTSFKNANLKLMAGDLHLVQDNVYRGGYDDMMYAEAASPSYSGFEEESLFEYHMYTLDGTTDIDNNVIKQLTLFTAYDVPVTKEYVYNPDRYNDVKTMLEFENSEDNNLGIPMPKGKTRVYVPDSTGQLQFVGEDSIDHTPKDELIRLYIGDAFDIVGERTTVDYESYGRCATSYNYQVNLRNHKDTAVEVKYVDQLYGEWKITNTNHEYIKESATEATWIVNVEPNEEVEVTYTVFTEYC